MTETLKAKVLLVDDGEDFLSTLAERLESRGLKVKSPSRISWTPRSSLFSDP